MKLPLLWLKDYIRTSRPDREIADIFTSIGHMMDEPVKGGVLSLEVRQNRADCLSILGLARELSAVTGEKVIEPEASDQRSTQEKLLVVESKNKVKRFYALHIKANTQGPPRFIKERLELYGIPSINNIVDTTNFVMVELGQPMHAFDVRKLAEGKLIVRDAKNREEFSTLLGTTIYLSDDDLVISDSKKVLGLAGVIGGNSSGVDFNSSEFIIEAANYDQASIRRSSRRHNIRTEASTRLEKFLSPKLPGIAMNRFIQILTENDVGFTALGLEDFANCKEKEPLKFNTTELKRLGGMDIKPEQVANILERLGIKVKANSDRWELDIPYYRTDIKCEEDIVEEILRIHGYENIPSIPLNTAPPKESTSPEYKMEDKIRDLFVSMGFDEHITEPLVKSSLKENEILLENPLNKDADSLRTEVTQTLRNALTAYAKHKIRGAKIFEVGKQYSKMGGNFLEERVASALVDESIPYRELKGYLETLLNNLSIADYNVNPKNSEGAIMQGNLTLGKIKRGNFTLYIGALVKANKAAPDTFRTAVKNEIIEDVTLEIGVTDYVGPIIDKIRNVSSLISKVEMTNSIIKGNEKAVTFKVTYKGSIARKDLPQIRGKIKRLPNR